ncbi:MAG: fibronectin type III domain-containing protein, partial [Patescibacteria group bacterium]
MRKILIFTTVLLGIFVISSDIAKAATIFLDNAATVTSNCATYDPAARSCGSGTSRVYTDVYAASQALANGDTLYIRAGEYWSDVTPYGGGTGASWWMGSLNIDNSSNILIKNYNNEYVLIKGGSSKTIPQYHPNNAIFLAGTNNTIDGISTFGGFVFGGSDNTLKNCDLSGGWDHQGPWGTTDAAWPNVIRLINSRNALIQNCKLHDNAQSAGGSFGNLALVMHEKDENTIFENNKFYNPIRGWVHPKYQSQNGTIQATYRYNEFVASASGGFEGAALNYGKIIKIYQNVFRGASADRYFFYQNMDPLTFQIYNNVFFNVGRPLYSWSTAALYAHNFFNNIIYNNVNGNYNISFDGSSFVHYSDYNNFYTPSGITASWWHNYGTRATTLSGWQSYSGLDLNSVNTNPNFINSSGSFSSSADFKRSSYSSNGRGGSWPSVMGAYITGNECIGLLSTCSGIPPPPPPPPPPADTQAPSIPTGLSATAISSSQINLSWTASTDNVGVTGYRIYRAGTQIATTANTNYSNTGLSASTAYSYIVSAYDAAGNLSAQSSSASATTQSASIDTTPPIRSSGAPSGVLPSSTTQTTLSLSTNETSTCKYSTTSGTAYASIANTFSSTNSTNHSTTISGLASGSSYSYYIRCQDQSNNANPDDFVITFSVALASVPPPAGTIAVDNVSTATQVAGAYTDLTFSHTVSGNDRLLIVSVALDHNYGEIVSSITYAGQNMIQVNSTHDGTWTQRAYIYSLINPPTGANNVIVSFSNRYSLGKAVSAVSFAGVNQTNPLGSSAISGGNNANPSLSLSSASNEMVFDVIGASVNATALAGPNQTEQFNVLANNNIRSAGSIEQGASTNNMSWILSSAGKFAMIAVPIKPAPVLPPPSDTTAPSIPTGLSATAISSSQINLSWTASTDNVGVTG